MKKAWKVYKSNPRLQENLHNALGITPYFAQVLINRGIKTPEQAQDFLFGDMDSCHDPFLMKDMAKSVKRIHDAVDSGEKILIYGDYDVDGVTSTALLADILKKMGANFDTFIPNRLEEGYGMNVRAVARAREKDVKLIITVDCGINSVKEVECARDYGIDVIITDHHEIKEQELPAAYSIIDTHQKDCAYPFKGLAGVGIAYKLARALLEGNEKTVDEHLDLVALGTVADIAPLNGENRILTKFGMKKLKNTSKAGLKAIIESARLDPVTINSRHIGFIIGPRINAMGRVGSANVALELMMCEDSVRARELARVLERENKNRQAIEKDLLKEALELAEERNVSNDNVIVLAGDNWHKGVLGIVASRLTEEFNKPCILIGIEDGIGKGSGRSVNTFNLFEAVRSSSKYLINYGGHEAACGIKIEEAKIDPFCAEINSVAINLDGLVAEFVPELKIDLSIPFAQIQLKLIRELEKLMPYGPENTEPIFSTNNVVVKNRPRDIGRNGFKFFTEYGDHTCEAVTFRKNTINKPSQGNVINLAYTPTINSWQGIETVQLNIKDLQLVS